MCMYFLMQILLQELFTAIDIQWVMLDINAEMHKDFYLTLHFFGQI